MKGALPDLPYERRCVVAQQLIERVVIRDDEVEIKTIVPANSGDVDVGLQDAPGVDSPANKHLNLGLIPLLPPEEVFHISIFAPLPEPHASAIKQRLRRAA
jgi:hypothetical protein